MTTLNIDLYQEDLQKEWMDHILNLQIKPNAEPERMFGGPVVSITLTLPDGTDLFISESGAITVKDGSVFVDYALEKEGLLAYAESFVPRLEIPYDSYNLMLPIHFFQSEGFEINATHTGEMTYEVATVEAIESYLKENGYTLLENDNQVDNLGKEVETKYAYVVYLTEGVHFALNYKVAE